MIEVLDVTLNPNDMGAGNVLSNNNLTVVNTLSTGIRATHSRSSGKFYFEVTFNDGHTSSGIGIANKLISFASTVSITNQNMRMYYGTNGSLYPDAKAYSTPWIAGDILGVLINLNDNTLEYTKNGVSYGIAYSNINTLGEIFPFYMSGNTTSKTVTFNFGASPFKHSLPVGYYSYDGKQSNTSKFLISSEDEYYSIKTVESKNQIPQMTSINSPSGQVSASSANTAGSEWRAFDRAESIWQTADILSEQWIQYKFENPTLINSYKIIGGTGAPTMAPKDFKLQGSHNGIDYVDLDEQRNQTTWATENSKLFYFKNEVSYLIYRLCLFSSNGAAAVRISEFELINEKNVILTKMSSASENNFLNLGMNRDESFDMIIPVRKTIVRQENSIGVGSGKVFRQKIDRSKHKAHKIILG